MITIMKRNVFAFLSGLAIVVCLFCTGKGYAQTAGTLTFTVNLTSHSAGYGLKHVSAIWVENASMAFVKTRYVKASGHTLSSHLPVWKANSGANVVDATTGATLTSYSPITATWNATNVSATLVPDGAYRVLVEFTWDDGSANHDTTSVSFTKGPASVHLTPVDKANFTGMVLDWAPDGASVQENALIKSILVYPNPTTGLVNIDFTKEISGCRIDVVNQSGALVFQEVMSPNFRGLKTIDLGGNANGIYFVNIQKDTQSKILKYKVILAK
jgi:hypothetical protein